jgi:RNA recognition motif-containing protein
MMRPSNFQGNIHIINFPVDVTAADLAALFDDYGLVLGAHVKTIPAEGGQMRLGIVAIAPDDAADRAIEALQGHAIGGHKLKLKKAKPYVKPPKVKSSGPAQRRPERTLSMSYSSADRFPARTPTEPPRKVIVEYRGRRGSRIISG